jgi:hypothetical protein
MSSPHVSDDWASMAGVTLLRVSLGIMFLAHSVHLNVPFTPDGRRPCEKARMVQGDLTPE